MNRRDNKCSYLVGIVEYIHATTCLQSAIISVGPITCNCHVKNMKVLKMSSRDLCCQHRRIYKKAGKKL